MYSASNTGHRYDIALFGTIHPTSADCLDDIEAPLVQRQPKNPGGL